MLLVLLLWRTLTNIDGEINPTVIISGWTGAKNKYLPYKDPFFKSFFIYCFTYSWDFPLKTSQLLSLERVFNICTILTFLYATFLKRYPAHLSCLSFFFSSLLLLTLNYFFSNDKVH